MTPPKTALLWAREEEESLGQVFGDPFAVGLDVGFDLRRSFDIADIE
jgi:hypothetical protein